MRVSDLARAAGATDDAHYVDFAGFDKGYHESWDMESAMHPQTLVAYGMDGHLLDARPRRAGARALAREARLQEHEVPHAASCSCPCGTAATGATRATSGTPVREDWLTGCRLTG